MAAQVGALRVSLGLESAAFTTGLTAAQKNLQRVGKQMQQVGVRMASIGAAMSVAITGPILAASAVAVSEAVEMRDALGQVSAALEAVGDTAKRSLGDFQDQANKLAASSLFEDDAILRDVTAALVRFGTMSGPIFDRAQQAIVNYAAATKKDLPAATAAIGRALSDPEKAAGRLARAGVILTAQQEAQVSAFMKAGNAAGAQGVLLTALEGKYRNAAQAARDAASPFERMSLTFKGIAGTVGATMLPVLDKVATVFADLAAKFENLSPKAQQFVIAGVAIAAALGPVLVVVGAVVGAIGLLVASPLLPFVAAAAVAAAGLGVVFARWGKEIIPAVVAFGKQVSDVVGPKITPLLEACGKAAKAMGDLFVAVFSDRGGEGSGGAASALKNFGTIVSRIFGAAVDIITGAVNVIANVVKMFAALFRGDIAGALAAQEAAVKAFGNTFVQVFKTLFPEVIEWCRKTVDGIKQWFGDRLTAIFDGVEAKVQGVSDAFFKLYDAVVGHSYVPDMVEGIAEWMAKLDAGMVVPAARATDAAKTAFETLRDDVAAIMESLLTDTERAARELSRVKITLAAGVKEGYVTDAEAKAAEGAKAWEGATLPSIPTLGSLGTDNVDIAQGIKDRTQEINDNLNDAAMRFGDAFSDNITRAMQGDIKGAFRDMLSDTLRNSLATLGAGLFKSAAGGGLGSIFQRIASSFSGSAGMSLGSSGGINFKGLIPGFASGGSFAL